MDAAMGILVFVLPLLGALLGLWAGRVHLGPPPDRRRPLERLLDREVARAVRRLQGR